MNDYLPLGKVAKQLPGNPSTISLWRWCRHGLTTRSGDRVRLPHIRMGKRILVRMADMEAFCKAVSDGDITYFEAMASEAAAPSADAQAAHRRLEAAGL